MKPSSKLIAIVLAHYALLVGAFAQQPSAREQFQEAVTNHQKTPNKETALKVIELYKQLDPPPAIPEEAREPFVMGATVLKEADDPAGAAKAVELFNQAVWIAPWWADARYQYWYPNAKGLDRIVFLNSMVSIMSRAGGTPQQVICYWGKVTGPSWNEIEWYFRNRSGVTGRAWFGTARGGATLYFADDLNEASFSKNQRYHYLCLQKAN